MVNNSPRAEYGLVLDLIFYYKLMLREPVLQ